MVMFFVVEVGGMDCDDCVGYVVGFGILVDVVV